MNNIHSHTLQNARQRMSYLIRNLSPATNYEARVHARNDHGWNKLSGIFHFSTRAEGWSHFTITHLHILQYPFHIFHLFMLSFPIIFIIIIIIFIFSVYIYLDVEMEPSAQPAVLKTAEIIDKDLTSATKSTIKISFTFIILAILLGKITTIQIFYFS